MKVFAVFSERKAGLVKVWADSWESRGWTPQLLSAREIEIHGSPRAAARARGGGLVGDIRVINFAYPVRRRPRRRIVWFGKPGWQTAALVRFRSDCSGSQVLECGRPL